jgi:hypothetical protein
MCIGELALTSNHSLRRKLCISIGIIDSYLIWAGHEEITVRHLDVGDGWSCATIFGSSGFDVLAG